MYCAMVLVFLVVYDLVPLSSAHEDCPTYFQCGNFQNLSFPFTDYTQPECGLLMANCYDPNSTDISLGQKSGKLQYSYTLIKGPLPGGNTVRVFDQFLKDQRCASLEDTIHQASSDAISFTVKPNVTVIKCNQTTDSTVEAFMGLTRYNVCHDFAIYYHNNPKEDGNLNPMYSIATLPPDCQPITLPMAPLDSINKESGLFDLFAAEFDLSWNLSDKCAGCIKVTGNRCTTDDMGFHFCSKHEKNKWKLVVSLASVITFVLAAASCLFMIRRRRKAKERRMKEGYIHQTTEKGIQDAPGVKVFSFEAILIATDNFSNDNKLGQGGYGPVYKGKLSDGREIAVKRLSKASGQGIQEFKSELLLISKLQHTNLVRLYGCCIHQEDKMLIYEFMPNKSLDFFLFAEDKKVTLAWRIRFNIIEGIGQGLLYLHKYSRMKVIHRDLKVSNVLLDENMNPKIADFGMARIFKPNVTEAITNRVVGTYGYMAPEYAMEGTFSIKSDVYSFGVLILEIVSGKRNYRAYDLDRPLNLVGYAWELWKRQATLELKDKAVGVTCNVKQLHRAVHVGLLCVQENADDRPTMLEVTHMLNNETADLPSPKQPAFFTSRQAVEVRSLETRSTDFLLDEIVPVTVNGLTITTMEAR